MAFLTDLEFIRDYITGKKVPVVGSEFNRQEVEQYLVEVLGWEKSDVEVDRRVEFEAAGEPWRSKVDLVVSLKGEPVMLIKCAAGSLGSREKEAVAAARIACDRPIALSVVSDGKTAVVIDTLSGKKIAEGLLAIPTPEKASSIVLPSEPLPEKNLERARLVFRSYDAMNVNR